MTRRILPLCTAIILLCLGAGTDAQQNRVPAPDRKPGEGLGPFKTLVIRGVTIIDGTGAPPAGPMDVVIEGNRIASIRPAGTPGVPLRPNRQPREFDHEIDATGWYMTPGFVNLHMHLGNGPKAPEAEYTYKLWMAHGVTAGRGVELAVLPGQAACR